MVLGTVKFSDFVFSNCLNRSSANSMYYIKQGLGEGYGWFLQGTNQKKQEVTVLNKNVSIIPLARKYADQIVQNH